MHHMPSFELINMQCSCSCCYGPSPCTSYISIGAIFSSHHFCTVCQCYHVLNLNRIDHANWRECENDTLHRHAEEQRKSQLQCAAHPMILNLFLVVIMRRSQCELGSDTMVSCTQSIQHMQEIVKFISIPMEIQLLCQSQHPFNTFSNTSEGRHLAVHCVQTSPDYITDPFLALTGKALQLLYQHHS